jgi:hypothetical protein
MKNQMASAKRAADKPLQRCPECGSEKVWRIQRSVAEKIICYTSEGKFASKKFLCKTCHNTYLIHRDDNEPCNTNAIGLDEKGNPLITCSQCGIQNVSITKLTIAELKLETGNSKTPFRKLVCNSCGADTVIYREDYEKASQEI